MSVPIVLSPVFLREDFTLSTTSFSIGETGPSAHQAYNNNQQDRRDRCTQTKVNPTDHGRRSWPFTRQHSTGETLSALPARARATPKHKRREGRLPRVPRTPRPLCMGGDNTIQSKPCAFYCEPLVAGTTTWSKKLEGEFMPLYSAYVPCCIVPNTCARLRRCD